MVAHRFEEASRSRNVLFPYINSIADASEHFVSRLSRVLARKKGFDQVTHFGLFTGFAMCLEGAA